MRRPLLPALLCLAVLVAPVRGADPPNVNDGLRWLAKKQGNDGSWGRDNQLALTGMAGLALLAAGSTPRRGPYSENIDRAIRFVLSCQKEDGKAFKHGSSGYSAIHNHGYALLFLTQAYGECGRLDPVIKQAIAQGLKATISSQYENGGFGYFLYKDQPAKHDQMWRWDEASTTISQIQALRGARDAGFAIAQLPLDRAGRYIKNSQHKTGGFYYSIGSPARRVSIEEGSNTPSFAVSAAGTAVLNALGTYSGPVVDRGLEFIEPFRPPYKKERVHFFYYGHYYAAQVMHMLGGARGQQWMSAIKDELATRQEQDGHWPSDQDSLQPTDSEILNTAWALQICLIDEGTLPLHER
ncbi:terpene cyclase/mutase family protein [bacterium]|nr:terpene cyclase/mutase family protein [bacterium]